VAWRRAVSRRAARAARRGRRTWRYYAANFTRRLLAFLSPYMPPPPWYDALPHVYGTSANQRFMPVCCFGSPLGGGHGAVLANGLFELDGDERT